MRFELSQPRTKIRTVSDCYSDLQRIGIDGKDNGYMLDGVCNRNCMWCYFVLQLLNFWNASCGSNRTEVVGGTCLTKFRV